MPYGEDLTNWPFKCDADMTKLEEQLHVVCEYPSPLRFKTTDVVILTDVGHKYLGKQHCQ